MKIPIFTLSPQSSPLSPPLMIHRSLTAALFSLFFAAIIVYLLRDGYEPMRTIVFVIAALLMLDALVFLGKYLLRRPR